MSCEFYSSRNASVLSQHPNVNIDQVLKVCSIEYNCIIPAYITVGVNLFGVR